MASNKVRRSNKRLRDARKELRLTQKNVADQLIRLAEQQEDGTLGCSAKDVGRWERGEVTPSLFSQRLLCTFFNKSGAELGFVEEIQGFDEITAKDEESIKQTSSSIPGTVKPAPEQRIENTPFFTGKKRLLIGVSIGLILLVLGSVITFIFWPRGWYPLLKQSWPYCIPEAGVSWTPNGTGTGVTCDHSYLTVQQMKAHDYGEVDLKEVQGSPLYSLNTLEVQVLATFTNPNDRATSAGILVQTPAGTAFGGYIFTVSPGWGQVQYVPYYSDGRYVPTVEPDCPIPPNIDFNQPVMITVMIQEGILRGYVSAKGGENELVCQYDEHQQSPNPLGGQIALMVENDSASMPSTQVKFSDFELDALH